MSSDQKLLFSFNIIINDLTSVPLLHGVLFLHWSVGRTEGFSPHFAVKNHEIRYGMSFHLEQHVELDRVNNVLEDVILKVRVNQEAEGGQEWTRFGVVHINLSEYAGSRETTRNFLLEQSKTNAALSVSIFSVLKSGGAPSFKVPESSKRFVRLEDEDEMEEGNSSGGGGLSGKTPSSSNANSNNGPFHSGGSAEAFKVHKSQETMISDQRYMVRERENLILPKHIVDTRVDNAEIVEALIAKVFHGIDLGT